MPTSEYGSGTEAVRNGTDSVPHVTTRHSTTRQGSGDFTSLVTNPPTSDRSVTSTSRRAGITVHRHGIVTQHGRRLGYVDRYSTGTRKWRWVLDGGFTSGFRFPTRAAALDGLLADPACPYQPGSAASMNSGSRVVSSASPSTGNQQ
jgi:hypothetical protein